MVLLLFYYGSCHKELSGIRAIPCYVTVGSDLLQISNGFIIQTNMFLIKLHNQMVRQLRCLHECGRRLANKFTTVVMVMLQICLVMLQCLH